MPRPERPIDLTGDALLAGLALRLRNARSRAGLTFREMSESARYSPAALAKAANGRDLPSWSCVEAFLKACGADDAVVEECERDWTTLHMRKAAAASPPATGSADVRVPSPRSVNDRESLISALRSLYGWAGKPPLRKLTELCGGLVKPATFSGMLANRHFPTVETVHAFVVACGVTELEEWLAARQRVFERLRLPTALIERFRIVERVTSDGTVHTLRVIGMDGTEQLIRLGASCPGPAGWWGTVYGEQQRPASRHLSVPIQYGTDGDQCWEISEYFSGGHILDAPRAIPVPPPVSTVRIVVAQLHAALAELGAAGLAHRALRPEVIRLRNSERLELVVTGFEHSIEVEDGDVTAEPPPYSTYASPEAFAGRGSVAGDWWSLGIVLRQLITGDRPVDGPDEDVIPLQLLTGEPAVDDITDEWMQMLVAGLLTRDPALRWGAPQVALWLQNSPPKVHRQMPRRLVFDGRSYRDRPGAAQALAGAWDLAVTTFLTDLGANGTPAAGWRTLRNWLDQFDGDPDAEERNRLVDHVLPAMPSPHGRLLLLLKWLDPALPPTYRRVRLGLRPGDLAVLAAADDQQTAAVLEDLWRYRLLPVLGAYAGREHLTDVDERWIDLSQRYQRALASWRLVPQVATLVGLRAARSRAELLRVADDPTLGQQLSVEASAALGALAIPRRFTILM